MATKPPFQVIVQGNRAPTTQESALHTAATTMFAESITEGRSFCKEMIGISTGAIAVYYLLFAYLVPEKYEADKTTGAMIVLPPILFFLAAVCFIVGFLPRVRDQNILELVKDPDHPSGTSVQEVRDAKIRWTNRWSAGGVAFFFVAVMLSAFTVLGIATADDPPAEPEKPQAALIVSETSVACGFISVDPETLAVSLVAGDERRETLSGVSSVQLVGSCPS